MNTVSNFSGETTKRGNKIMTDSIQANKAAASNDFNQFKGTLNALESNKITQDQATQAFHAEFAQMTKNGDNDAVDTLMANSLKSGSSLNDFPDLKIDYDSNGNAYRFTASNITDANAAKATSVCFEDGDVGIMSASDSTKLDTATKIANSITNTSKQYLENGASADSTTKQLNQEMASAKAAGIDFTDPKFAELIKGDGTFNAAWAGAGNYDITEDAYGAIGKDIFLNTNTGVAQVKNYHVIAQAYGSALLRDTSIGAGLGFCFGLAPGALIGGGIGLAVGIVDGMSQDGAFIENLGSDDGSIQRAESRSFFSKLWTP
jgi:hypothetical protein